MMLAATEASTVLIVVCTVVMAVCAVATLFAVFRKNTRREVSLLQDYATSDDLRELKTSFSEHTANDVQEFSAVRAEMKEDKEAILKAGEERAEKLHKRINRILVGVSRIQGRLGLKDDHEGEEEL